MHRTLLVALLTMTTVLAGCAENQGPAQEVLLGVDGVEEGAELGVVHAMVFAEYGAPVMDARVSMLGTVFSDATDEMGMAEFPNVPVGTYTLRIEADRIIPSERTIVVGTSNVTHEEFVLVLVDPSSDARTHTHDYWAGDSEVLITDAMMPAVPRYKTDAFAWWPEGYNDVLNGIHRMNNNQTGEDPDYLFRVPMTEDTPDGSRQALVYPGTQRIEVTVAWDSPMTRAEKMGVAYIAPESDELVVLDRKESGGLWNIPLTPEMADNGHQTFSFWNFFLYSGNEFMSNPAGDPAQYSFDEPFHVTIKVFKGELTYEPPHRDFWGDDAVKQFRLESEQDISPLTVRDWRNENSGHVFMPEDELIPPGTQRMVVEYTYIHGDPDNNDDSGTLPQPQTLTFRTADQNPWETPVGEYRRLEATSCAEEPEKGTCLRYEFEMEKGWADAFYQSQSLWAFLTNVEGGEDERRYSQTAGGSLTMILDVTLYGPEA